MRAAGRWILVVVMALLLVLAAGWGAVHWWLGSNDLHQRTEQRLSAVLGVDVRLGRMRVDVWPLPAVAVKEVEILTRPVLRIESIELRPQLRALLNRRFEVTTAVLHRAELSQAGVAQLLDAMAAQTASPGGWVVALPRHVVLDGVHWQPDEGQGLRVDADLRLDVDGLPEQGQFQVREGWLQGTRLALWSTQARRWQARAEVAGGVVEGEVALLQLPAKDRPLRMEGNAQSRGLDLAMLARIMGRKASLHGTLEATSTWQVQAQGWNSLVAGLRSQSKFKVKEGVLQGLDLVRAVRTVGLNRGGETRLDQLTGQLDSHARNLRLNRLEASSGLLHATGSVVVSPSRTLAGRVVVSLTPAAMLAPVMGVPLQVGGTLDSPSVTLTRSAMLGAAIGTAVLPGVGTGAGASLGERVGDAVKGLFGR